MCIETFIVIHHCQSVCRMFRKQHERHHNEWSNDRHPALFFLRLHAASALVYRHLQMCAVTRRKRGRLSLSARSPSSCTFTARALSVQACVRPFTSWRIDSLSFTCRGGYRCRSLCKPVLLWLEPTSLWYRIVLCARANETVHEEQRWTPRQRR